MLQTIFSAYRALLFPVLLSWIRGRADVQSLKALGSQRQTLSMRFLMRNPQWAEPSVDVVRVKELKESGMGASAIAKEMGIGRASVYRALGS